MPRRRRYLSAWRNDGPGPAIITAGRAFYRGERTGGQGPQGRERLALRLLSGVIGPIACWVNSLTRS